MNKLNYFIYTDASFCKKNNCAVSGFLIFRGEKNHQSGNFEPPGIQTQSFSETNNIRAEIMGALHVFHTLNNLFQIRHQKQIDCEVHLYSDCQTITSLNSRKSKLEAREFKSSRTNAPLRNAELYKEFFILTEKLNLKIHWVKGHSKKMDQSYIQKNFQIVDQEVRKKLRIKISSLLE